MYSKSVILSGLLLLGALCSLLFLTENPLTLDDALRHFVMAEYYRDHGLMSHPGWGTFFFTGYFARYVLDPWFLADLAYVPFTFFGDRVFGIKMATVTFAGVFLLCILPFLRQYRTPPFFCPFALLLLIFGSHGFLSRMLLGRPFVLLSALFLLAYFLIVRRQWMLLGAVLLFATLVSYLFVFLLFLSLAGAAWLFLQPSGKRPAAYCALFSSAGVAAGMILHPHTVSYLLYLSNVFFIIPFSKHIGIGSEFESGIANADIALFLFLSLILLFFSIACRHRSFWRMVQMRPEIVLTIALSAFFFGMYLFWSRAVDFLWPLLILLSLQCVSVAGALPRGAVTPTQIRFWSKILVSVCLVNFLSIASSLLLIDPPRSPQRYAAIVAVPEGSHVLNIDWDVFPALLFLNDSVLYARGMDPTFDIVDDQRRFALLEAPNDWWNWKFSDPMESFAGFWERFDLKTMTIQHQREAELDVRGWVRSLRDEFAPTHLAVKRSFHLRLIEELRGVLTVHAESPALVVFEFSEE